MKCRNCGHEISDRDVFCPVCSVLAPVKHRNKLSIFFTKLKEYICNKDSVAIMCLCEILLNALFMLTCFSKCFVIANDQIYIQLSMWDSFVGNSKFNFVLIIILNILTDILLFRFILNRTAVFRTMLLIPVATYAWNIVQFMVKVSTVSKTLANSGDSVQFSLTLTGWMLPAICIISISMLVFIILKLRKKFETTT